MFQKACHFYIFNSVILKLNRTLYEQTIVLCILFHVPVFNNCCRNRVYVMSTTTKMDMCKIICRFPEESFVPAKDEHQSEKDVEFCINTKLTLLVYTG